VRVPVFITVFALSAAGLLAGCGSDSGDSGAATTQPATTAAATSTETATGTTSTGAAAEITTCLEKGQPAPSAKPNFTKAEQVLKSGTDYAIVMKTSCGTIRIALDPKAGGPIPNSIAYLVSQGYYDGLTFHRVVPGFVLQGGDPQGDGSGGPGYQVVGPVPAGYQYKLGDVAMAKAGPEPGGTAGSQFFVVSSDEGGAGLTPDYGILGHATDAASLATIKRIDALGVPGTSLDPPSKPVWIISAKLVPSA
jgi:cyclophilin family peptidyl-prolyl cis-trans isomerase